MKTVKERIIAYIKDTGISQKKFEETVGVSNGYVNNVKASPSSTVLQKIFCAFPDINRDWLLTGEGPMLVSDLPGSVHQQSTGDNSPNVNGSGNVVGGVGGGGGGRHGHGPAKSPRNDRDPEQHHQHAHGPRKRPQEADKGTKEERISI